ncbi:MAG: SDR family oxidoreductase [Desulfobacteraceae bacterium]
MKGKITGCRALILGGTCDLALGLAQALAEEGVCPILTWRSDTGKGRMHEALMHMDGAFEAVNCDLGQKETLSALSPVLDKGIDYLVDFAQGDLEGLVASVDAEEVSAYVEVNIANRAEVIQQVSRAMVSRRKGRMVYISSAAAGRPNPGQGFYAAAKLASEALYRNAGLELASRGVTTVILRPGYINAGRGRCYLASNGDTVLAKVPLGRALEIGEVVAAILFLLSDGAAGFNATILTMDGGLTAGK